MKICKIFGFVLTDTNSSPNNLSIFSSASSDKIKRQKFWLENFFFQRVDRINLSFNTTCDFCWVDRDLGVTHQVGGFSLTKIIKGFLICCRSAWWDRESSTVIFYNPAPEWVGAALVYRYRKVTVIIQLDDYPVLSFRSPRSFANYLALFILSAFTNNFMISTSQIKKRPLVANKNIFVYRGLFPAEGQDFTSEKHSDYGGELKIHLCGTFREETGTSILAATLQKLSISERPLLKLVFYLTSFPGGGLERIVVPSLPEFVSVSTDWLNDVELDALRRKCHIGINLRNPYDKINVTTFPSKVIDIVAYSQLLITTENPELRGLLSDDGMVTLSGPSLETIGENLASVLLNFANDPTPISRIASRGFVNLRSQISDLSGFKNFFNDTK